MISLSKEQEKKLLQLAKKSNNSISAKEYNKIISANKKRVKTQSRMSAAEYRELQKSGKYISKKREFSFTLDIKEIHYKKEYLFILYGKHLSTNSMDSLSFKARLQYKKAIKKAFYDFALCNKKILLKSPIESKVELFPKAWIKSHIHRDDDGYRTLKPIRDMIINLGFVTDDSPLYLQQHKTEEFLGNEWKIEILLKAV